MRITCLVKRWDHHTASGGYDRLAEMVGAKIIQRIRSDGLSYQIAKKLWMGRNSSNRYLVDYQFGDWLAELKFLATASYRPPDVLHVLYGDEQLDLLLRWRRFLRCRLVVTFHLPADRVASRFEAAQPEIGKAIDAAVVLASNEITRFENWIGAAKVAYVPHGIDTSIFRPAKGRPDTERIRLLFVGEHMRDWEVMHRVMDECYYRHVPVDFDIVTKESFCAKFTGCMNATFHTNISKSALIELYRSADALLVPVLSATATNSILEALACGTPIISTKIGGIPDYVSGECGWLLQKGNISQVLNLIEQLCADREIALSRREAARLRSLQFDWNVVAKQMNFIYAAVAAGRSPLTKDTLEQSPILTTGAVTRLSND